MVVPVRSGAVAIVSTYAPAFKSISAVNIAEYTLQMSDPSAPFLEW